LKVVDRATRLLQFLQIVHFDSIRYCPHRKGQLFLDAPRFTVLCMSSIGDSIFQGIKDIILID